MLTMFDEMYVLSVLTMKGHAVHVIFNVPAKNRLCPIFQVVLVVIVGQDKHLGVVGIERGTQEPVDEVSLSCGVECASLPGSSELRFILRRDGPYGDTFMLVRGDELGDVQSPRRVHARIVLQTIRSDATQHAGLASIHRFLHPCWWRPWRRLYKVVVVVVVNVIEVDTLLRGIVR